MGGRDKSSLLDGLAGQVDAVRAVLAAVSADVPVRGTLCFVGTELPWFGSSSIASIPLVGRRGLAKLLKQPGDLAPDDRAALAAYLEGPLHPRLTTGASSVTRKNSRRHAGARDPRIDPSGPASLCVRQWTLMPSSGRWTFAGTVDVPLVGSCG